MSENKAHLAYIKELNILYLEDDENTRCMVEFFLKDKVKTLYVGIDGKKVLNYIKNINLI